MEDFFLETEKKNTHNKHYLNRIEYDLIYGWHKEQIIIFSSNIIVKISFTRQLITNYYLRYIDILK